MNCKAVVFDLDGTLIDSLPDLYISTNYALDQCGFPRRTEAEVRAFVGNGISELIRRAVPEATEAATVSRCLDFFRRHYVDHCCDHTVAYEGIVSMLSSLRSMGLRTAVVSNKLQAGVDTICQRLFAGIIDVAVGEHEGLRKKPFPDMLVAAMRQLHAHASEVVYVGDSDVDILTARACQVPCLSVTWGFRSRDFLCAHGATSLIAHPSEIIDSVARP